MPPTILISCGEPSGDLYAGALAAELRRLEPGARLVGLGGEHLRRAGADLVGDYRGLAVTGLSEALAVLPRSLAMYRRLVTAARRLRPDVFVAIDFPDFNFPVARAVDRLGIPVVYYIPPQLWAWRPRRLAAMKRWTRQVLVIFPFEPPLYRQAGIPVEFVGHPLIDLARAREPRERFLPQAGLDPTRPVVALLPGSRPNEVRAILPRLVAAVARLARRVGGLQAAVAEAPHLEGRLFAPIASLTHAGVPTAVVSGRTDEVLAAADVVLTASGTATVQAALHERPMVIVYRVAPLTYALGKRLVRVDTYGMVNLVLGRKAVPELVQAAFTPEAVADEAFGLLTDPARIAAVQADLRELRARLGAPGASRRAAEAVLRVAVGGPPP
jgi:lipid-A-disaccharide synthase